MPRITYACALLFLAAVAGCSAPQPYVYGDLEREVLEEDFIAAPPDIVRVCYSDIYNDSRAVIALAHEACRDKGFVGARFQRQDYLACPVVQPLRAHFRCHTPVAPAPAVTGRQGGASDADGIGFQPPPPLPPDLRP